MLWQIFRQEVLFKLSLAYWWWWWSFCSPALPLLSLRSFSALYHPCLNTVGRQELLVSGDYGRARNIYRRVLTALQWSSLCQASTIWPDQHGWPHQETVAPAGIALRVTKALKPLYRGKVTILREDRRVKPPNMFCRDAPISIFGVRLSNHYLHGVLAIVKTHHLKNPVEGHFALTLHPMPFILRRNLAP